MPTKKSITKTVALAVVSNSTGQIANITIGLLLTPHVLASLPGSEFGLWALASSIVAYGSLLEFGIGNTLIKYVAEFNARDRIQEAATLVNSALTLHVLIGLALMAVIHLLAPLTPLLFPMNASEARLTVPLVSLVGIHGGLLIPCGASLAVLSGLCRFDWANALTVLGTALSALATIAVLSFGGGAKGIVAGSIASTLVVQVVAVVVIRRIAPGLSFGRPSWDGAAMRSVVSYSSAMFLLQFSTLLLTRSDELVIARVMSLEAITPYVLARRLSELPHLITDQAMGVLLPVASGLAALDEMETLQKLLLTSSRLCLAVLVSLTVPLAMLAGHALKLWLGAPYQAYAYLVVILATSMLIDSASWPAGSVLLGKARHYPVAISSAIAAVSSIVLSAVLGQRLGLAGIALGTLLPTAAVCLFFVLPFSLHVCDISIKTFTSQVVVPALAPAVPAAGLIAVCMHILAELTFIHLLLTAAGALAVYWPVYLRWSATEDELRSIIGMVPESVRYLCMPQKP